MPWLAGFLVGTAAVVRLFDVLSQVANRHAFGWDSARRAVLDVRAGDALRGGHLLDFLWYVAGPETWPTLRLVPASVVHAIVGPRHAFAVEHALSILAIGGIAIAVAYAARAVTESAVGATVVTLLSLALLAGNGALLGHAANGMLEPLSAALTAAAVAAWIEARTRGAARPWVMAIFANLVFHTKWQHGILLAIAVLALEWLAPDELRSASASSRAVFAALAALARAVRTGLGAVLLATTALSFALALAIGMGSGFSFAVGGIPIGLRTIHGPLAFGGLAAFLFVEAAFWRARHALRDVAPARLRFSWAWIATPMAGWLLVPGTWRLRTILVTSGTYDSGEALPGWWARIGYYTDAAWSSWTVPAVHPIMIFLLAATIVAAWRSETLRRRLLPVLVLVALQWVFLTFATRHNYQARFLVNLAPIVAVALCAWVGALPLRWAAAGGAAVLVALAIPSFPAWSRAGLVATIAQGFDPADHATACRAVMERLPVERFQLVNRAPLSHRQGCSLWATVIARKRGEKLDHDGVIALSGVADPPPALPGFRRSSAEVVSGPLRAGVYEKMR